MIRKPPRERQNLFFSATFMPGAIATLSGEILRDPLEVRVALQATTVERVIQRVIHVEADRKRDILVDLLALRDVSRAIVFTRTKRGRLDRLASSSPLPASRWPPSTATEPGPARAAWPT